MQEPRVEQLMGKLRRLQQGSVWLGPVSVLNCARCIMYFREKLVDLEGIGLFRPNSDIVRTNKI